MACKDFQDKNWWFQKYTGEDYGKSYLVVAKMKKKNFFNKKCFIINLLL